MIIKNIILKDLFKVLNSLPKGTIKIDIEYSETEEESKITIYPSPEDDEEEEDPRPNISNRVDDPDISPDEDLINLI
jgi:hypothetical protein